MPAREVMAQPGPVRADPDRGRWRYATYPGRMDWMTSGQALPWTVDSLAGDLADLGVRPGSTLVVHSSLSSLGYVTGGAHTVVLALLDALGPEGTLVVPTHSGDLSDPGQWVNPPVPVAWWPTIRAAMPAYDPRLTGTRGMGAVPDTVRHLPGALRSAHPAYSFCAVGPTAAVVTEGHELADGLGEASPLGRLYDLGADILLLGVGHGSDTSLHLAEHRSGTCGTRIQSAPILVDGVRRWVEFEELDVDTDDFEAVGAAAAAAGLERTGTVGRCHRPIAVATVGGRLRHRVVSTAPHLTAGAHRRSGSEARRAPADRESRPRHRRSVRTTSRAWGASAPASAWIAPW